MSRSRRSLRGEWRSYFRDRCRSDVRSLADDYPERRSLYVDLIDLYDHDAEFARTLFDAPDRVLRQATATLRDGYDPFERVHVRVTNNPQLLSVSAVRSRHRHELVTVEGVVDSVDHVQSTATEAVYECPECGECPSVHQTGVELSDPGRCGDCGWDGAFEFRPDRSRFGDLQRVSIAEPPEERDDDGPPRTLAVFLDDDLVGAADPNGYCFVTGIVRMRGTAQSNRFELYLDGVAVSEEREVPESEGIKDTLESHWESLSDA